MQLKDISVSTIPGALSTLEALCDYALYKSTFTSQQVSLAVLSDLCVDYIDYLVINYSEVDNHLSHIKIHKAAGPEASQNGFSVTSHCINSNTSHKWMVVLDKRGSVRALFVDFIADHNVLYSKLKNFNIPHNLLKWFALYLLLSAFSKAVMRFPLGKHSVVECLYVVHSPEGIHVKAAREVYKFVNDNHSLRTDTSVSF